VLASLYGMNVELPHFPGGSQFTFWWILAIMLATSGIMLWIFKRKDYL
jgi:Mg2+ and Co2+ transporter CorA